MGYAVHIGGNHESPNGNPIPYERMTQRGKFVKKSAQRYIAWVNFVQSQWLKQAGVPLPQKKSGHYKLHVTCGFAGENHGDPDNIFKAIADAIFKLSGDKHVSGSVDFLHVKKYPFVDFYVEECLPK